MREPAVKKQSVGCVEELAGNNVEIGERAYDRSY
jgi:hypothetical protein